MKDEKNLPEDGNLLVHIPMTATTRSYDKFRLRASRFVFFRLSFAAQRPSNG
jgi:hypothetical protein